VDITELCPSATVLAQQLTHVELERLSYIGPEEFVQAFAKVSTFDLSKNIAVGNKHLLVSRTRSIALRHKDVIKVSSL